MSKQSKVLPAVFSPEAVLTLRQAGHAGEIAVVDGDEVLIISATKAKRVQKPLTEERVRELIRQELTKSKKRPKRKTPCNEPVFAYGTPFTCKRKRPVPASEPVAVYGAPFTRKRKKTW